ncbi:hypothetical protein ASG29_15295 [Sphingomonas sp. Leaf412]|uniref:hypothetical protein n=1 Tax=Sphingomonas sp. Leaf412 TaxID=1736370 RepID=UPI0006FC6DAD|nr:hypothetical protein [Sphingomonas sp. Leaf412]KQT31323.1 hypothetical protein ASG29_15295 [Sphingomonas sp. Leaf412]
MTRRRAAAAMPFVAGLALLAGGWWLLPGQSEVATAASRMAAPVSVPVPPRAPAARAPAPPEFAALVRDADATTLARATARLRARVSTAQVAWDLKAAGRAAVALDYLALRPDGATPDTWRLRVDLMHAAGRARAATALLEAAATTRGAAPARDMVEAAYAADRADLVARAVAGGVVPLDGAARLDLVRRMEAAKRFDLIAAMDRAAPADWRARDPWLALRVATQAGDRDAAMRAVALLPADQRDAAREGVLTRAGDRAGLRDLWRAQAARAGADRAGIAERLLAAGFRDDALAVLRDAATGTPDGPAAQRLLYLMGPRPAGGDLAWLKARARDAAWLDAYADRDRPAAALAFLAAHPLAGTTDVLATRMRLARASGDDRAGRIALAALLDGRALDDATFRRIAAAVPRTMPAALTQELATRRIAAGVAGKGEVMDLAWAAWNRGDVAATDRWLRAALSADADDASALRLMADVQAKRGGAKAARPWLERALAATPAPTRERAELLDRLGRRQEAMRIVAGLRADAPDDRALAAMQARLLIAAGRPGEARAVLAP